MKAALILEGATKVVPDGPRLNAQGVKRIYTTT